MAFTKFYRGRWRRGGEFVSINKSGTLLISREAYENLFKDVPAVELLYDDSRKVIGLAPVKKKTDDSYFVRSSSGLKRGKSPIYTISAAAFLKFFSIDFRRTTKFPVSKAKNGIIEIDLNHPFKEEAAEN